MPFADADIAQIRAIIHDTLRTATVHTYTWRGTHNERTVLVFAPGPPAVDYHIAIDPTVLDRIADALAERCARPG